jgi:carbamoyltransferase
MDRPAEEIADLIHQGKLVGRFAGRMEWGPRALGNRSILIRPIDKTINDSVNQRLARTEFMPFAPSMLESVASDYMADWKPEHVAAEFMTITYGIRPERQKEIEAVVHVDGTARPQVVRRDVNESYWQIIEAYQRRSGLGVIVNTSFNMHEEPIVCTPQDAIRSLTRGCVDVLAIEDYLVTPR